MDKLAGRSALAEEIRAMSARY